MTVPVLPENRFSEFKSYLERVGFAFEERPHQVFLARSPGLVVSLYRSGKVVIAGRDRRLEREVTWYLDRLGAAGEALPERLARVFGRARIGTDESGKGDFFGPLVVAGVFLSPEAERMTGKLGVRDSKELSDRRVAELEPGIMAAAGAGGWEVLRIDPKRYNTLYGEMGNLNILLAWAHSRVIENLLRSHPGCTLAVVDQFSAAALDGALLDRGRMVEVVQSIRGERDPAVACASVLARAEFLRRLDRMGEEYGLVFPKGASAVLPFARQFVAQRGLARLGMVAKLHFQTAKKITGGSALVAGRGKAQ